MKTDRPLFQTGIALIDNQHERYLELVDELLELKAHPHVAQAHIDACLRKTLAYAVEHFDAEEALMISIRYPAYETHRSKHDEFRAAADRICALNRSALDPDEQLALLTKWLVGWFHEHTLVHDSALAAFLKSERDHAPPIHVSRRVNASADG